MSAVLVMEVKLPTHAPADWSAAFIGQPIIPVMMCAEVHGDRSNVKTERDGTE
jgi:hypothetical protein